MREDAKLCQGSRYGQIFDETDRRRRCIQISRRSNRHHRVNHPPARPSRRANRRKSAIRTISRPRIPATAAASWISIVRQSSSSDRVSDLAIRLALESPGGRFRRLLRIGPPVFAKNAKDLVEQLQVNLRSGDKRCPLAETPITAQRRSAVCRCEKTAIHRIVKIETAGRNQQISDPRPAPQNMLQIVAKRIPRPLAAVTDCSRTNPSKSRPGPDASD